MRVAWLVVLAACGGSGQGDPDASPGDGPPPSELSVQLIAPNGGEQLEAAVATTIHWAGVDGDVSVALDLIDGAGNASPIARELASPAGQDGTFAWSPSGVPAPTQFKVRITITDQSGGVASDDSDAELTISPPATGVSLAADLGPIFTAKCNNGFCHNTQNQASALNLELGKAYASLVGVKSKHTACASFDRVAPGSPTTSFLIFKLQGNGSCFAGVRMPKGSSALPAAEIQLVRDWISEGAKDN